LVRYITWMSLDVKRIDVLGLFVVRKFGNKIMGMGGVLDLYQCWDFNPNMLRGHLNAPPWAYPPVHYPVHPTPKLLPESKTEVEKNTASLESLAPWETMQREARLPQSGGETCLTRG
jgi:hypothetical protein